MLEFPSISPWLFMHTADCSISWPWSQVVNAIEALEPTRTLLFDLQSDEGESPHQGLHVIPLIF